MKNFQAVTHQNLQLDVMINIIEQLIHFFQKLNRTCSETKINRYHNLGSKPLYVSVYITFRTKV